MYQNALSQSNCKNLKFIGNRWNNLIFFACDYKFLKSKSRMKHFQVGMVKNRCGRSDQWTLKLEIHQEWIDGINRFFYAHASLGKITTSLIFKCAWSKMSNNSRRRNIWFNPSYSWNVITKICRNVSLLLDRFFPEHHHLYKFSNENNIKSSNSSLSNFYIISNSLKKKISDDNRARLQKVTCNCQISFCPLYDNCLQSGIICCLKTANPNITINNPQ